MILLVFISCVIQRLSHLLLLTAVIHVEQFYYPRKHWFYPVFSVISIRSPSPLLGPLSPAGAFMC